MSRPGPKTHKGPCTICNWEGLVSVAQKSCKQIITNKSSGQAEQCKGKLDFNDTKSSSSSYSKKRERDRDLDERPVLQNGDIQVCQGNPFSDVLKNQVLKLIKNAIKGRNEHAYWKQFETCCDEWVLKNTGGSETMDPFVQRGRFENIYRVKIHDDIERKTTPKEDSLLIKFDERKMIVTIMGDDTDEDGKWSREDFHNNCCLTMRVAFHIKFVDDKLEIDE